MTKYTRFTKDKVRIQKGLALGAELIQGLILVPDFLTDPIDGGSLSSGNWTTWDVKDLAEAVGGNMPQDAYAVILDVEIQDSGTTIGGDAWLAFAAPGAIIGDGKTQYVDAAPRNNTYSSRIVIVPISKDGKIAVEAEATGAGTLNYTVKLIGWLVGGTDLPAIELPYADLKVTLTVNHP